jgi:hypothetical protein
VIGSAVAADGAGVIADYPFLPAELVRVAPAGLVAVGLVRMIGAASIYPARLSTISP